MDLRDGHVALSLSICLPGSPGHSQNRCFIVSVAAADGDVVENTQPIAHGHMHVGDTVIFL